MVEVEMKFRVDSFGPLEQRLAALGARVQPVRHEIDHYFNAPDRDFAKTDEAFRLRRVGKANYLTYKGPKRDAQTKTRTEVEVPLGPEDVTANAATQMFVHLGYRPVAIVRKARRIYHLEREGFSLEVCLDEVEEVGPFAELEILVPEEHLDTARQVLKQTALELGLTDSERRSYLEMLLTLRGESGR